MSSMSVLATLSLDAPLSGLKAKLPVDRSAFARLGVLEGTDALLPERETMKLGWSELEHALPDRGLPRGVIEIASMPKLSGARASAFVPESMRGGATAIAISAVGAAHRDPRAWCAWLTPRSSEEPPSLYAPALAQGGVDLDRLLVVRPQPEAFARSIVKVAASGAFEVVIVDVPETALLPNTRSARGGAVQDMATVVVRKLALAAEESGTTTLLLTSALSKRSLPLPVALRIEVERRPSALGIRVTKDRRGVGSSQHVVRLAV